MSFQERTPITIIATTTILYVLFLSKMRKAAGEGKFDGAEGLIFTGKSFLIFIAIMIVTMIVLFIIQAIIETIRTGDENAVEDIEDERDRAYEFHSLKVSSNINGIFFCFGLGSLWAGASAPVAIHIIAFGMIGGSIAGAFRKFWLYRGE